MNVNPSFLIFTFHTSHTNRTYTAVILTGNVQYLLNIEWELWNVIDKYKRKFKKHGKTALLDGKNN